MNTDQLKHADGTRCAGRRCAFLSSGGHRFDRPTAFHTDESMVRDGYVQTMIVTADEPGYHEGPDICVGTFVEAKAQIVAWNAALELTEDQARNIIASSMFGVPYAE